MIDRLFSTLRRRPTSVRFIAEVDGLRFVCIAFVVIYHLVGFVTANKGNIWTPERISDNGLVHVASLGYRAVPLFFMISGFILSLPFASQYVKNSPQIQLRSYYLRRLTRLEPPYVLSLLCFYFALAVMYGDASTQLPHLLASIFYLHGPIYGELSTINPVAWSLEIEVQFYLVAPLLSGLFAFQNPHVRRSIFIGLSVISMVVQYAFIPNEGRLYFTLINFLQYFMIGLLAADVYLADWRGAPLTTPFWDGVAIIVWPIIFSLQMNDALETFLFPVFAMLAFFTVFRSRIVRGILRNRWLVVIGGMCYTIYLLHFPLISQIGRFTLRAATDFSLTATIMVQILMMTPCILLICMVYFLAIEKPCMDKDWLKKSLSYIRGFLMEHRVARP